jgi:uncharacterized membrane protein
MATHTPSAPSTVASGHAPAEERTEQLVGNVLRAGVLIAAAVALVGGIAFLAHYGLVRADYATFRGEPEALSTLGGIVRGALALHWPAVVQLGIVLLIATPVARVLLTVVAFAVRKDWMYVLVSAVVFALLIYSLLGG